MMDVYDIDGNVIEGDLEGRWKEFSFTFKNVEVTVNKFAGTGVVPVKDFEENDLSFIRSRKLNSCPEVNKLDKL